MFKLDSKTGLGTCEEFPNPFRYPLHIRLRSFFVPSSLCSIVVVGSSINLIGLTPINNTNMIHCYICLLYTNQYVMRMHLPKRGESAAPAVAEKKKNQ